MLLLPPAEMATCLLVLLVMLLPLLLLLSIYTLVSGLKVICL